jgi:hypothetical protein
MHLNVGDALRCRMKVGIRGSVDHAGGVKQINVGERADIDHASISQAEAAGGQASHLVDGGWQREQVFIAGIVAQHAGEGVPQTGLRRSSWARADQGQGMPEFMVSDALASRKVMRLSARAWTSQQACHLVYPTALTNLEPLRLFRLCLTAQVALYERLYEGQ